MTNKKEISAGIIIIGNEVLSGRTKDINTSTLAKWLNKLGIEVKEVRIVPESPTATKALLKVTPKRFSEVPDVLEVQEVPSEEVRMVPECPTATKVLLA